MNSFEINKIIAAIILTIVIVFGINKLADVIYNVKAPEGNTYNIVTETKEISKDDAVNVGSDVNIIALLALGSIDHGKMVFKKCAACHSVLKGGGNKIGPALWGVIGRKAGSTSDYKYSKVTYDKAYHHVGIYSFRYETLKKFISLTPSINELNHKLEQWRALDAKMTIGVSYVKDVPISVDTKKDLINVENIIKNKL